MIVVATADFELYHGLVTELRERTVEPTVGELDVIKARSREQSEINWEIDEALARRVAAGELSIEEALAEHQTRANGE